MFWDIIKKFPPFVSSHYYKKIFEELEINISHSRYLTFSITVFLIATLLGYVAGMIYLGIFPLIALLIYPIMLKKQEEQAIFSQLPLFLIDLGSLINIGVPLLDSIRIASTGKLKEIIERVLQRVEKNESLTSVFIYLVQKYQNPLIKRAFTQLIAAIETGSGKELKQLGIELLKGQIHNLKEFGGKLSIITQFFISFNVILPVFVILLIMAIPLITNQQPSLEILNYVVFIIFPLLGVLFLVFSYVIFPETAFTQPNINYKILVIGFVSMIVVYVAKLNEIVSDMLFFGIFLISFLRSLKDKNKYEELDKEVPQVLLMLSAFPRFDLEGFFQQLAASNLKLIKNISKNVINIIRTNQNPSEIFIYLKRFPGTLFNRFVSILEFSYQTGSSLGEKLAEWAEALYQYITAKKEIEATFTVQKYTLLIGAILTPTILGAMVRVFEELFNLEVSYIFPFTLMSTALIFTLINLISKIKIYWYFFISALGLILFYFARQII